MMLTSLLLLITISLSWPLGIYLTWVLEPRSLGTFRNAFGQLSIFFLGKSILKQQNWKSYSASLLIFNLLMFAGSFLILLNQGQLPLNPDGKTNVELWLAFNTAASFTTNTNLQHYSGEVIMSYFSQLYGLMWLQFVSVATGLSALAALSRGLRGSVYVGNFFADLWNVTALIFYRSRCF